MSGYPGVEPSAAIGAEPGRLAFAAAATRDLGSGAEVLPEIVITPERQRPWWRHPAFLVSVITTFLALAAAVVWWVIAMVTDDSVRVENLTVDTDAGNVTLQWNGPDAAYSLFQIPPDGEATDLTQLVRGTSAWVFSAAGLYTEGSCFVVRPASVDGDVSLDAATLESQRGAGACLADAR